MESQMLKILKVKQNIYTYKYIEHKVKVVNKNMFKTLLMFFLVFGLFSGFKISNISTFNEIVNTATYIVNPINPLYYDLGNIVFTNGLDKVELNERNFEFVPPVNFTIYTQSEHSIDFYVENDVTLKAIEKGVVSDIYVESNNVKCIKIKHSKSTYSIVKNVDVLGVCIGALVDKNQIIGTAKDNCYINVFIEVNGIARKLNFSGNNICVN